MKGHEPYIFCFRVKFYPPDPSKLQEEITRYQLFLQMRRDLLHGRLFCSPSDSAWLAAHVIQSELGDYDPDVHQEGYVSEFKVLLKQTPKQEEKIAEIHQAQLSGQTPATAELNFIKKASAFDTYGVDPHPVKDQKGSHLYVGITHTGIMTFQGNKKTHHFKWPDVQKLHFEGKMFIIHLTYNEKKHACGFKCPTVAACRHLWKCSVEQKTFWTVPSSREVTTFSSGSSTLMTLARGSRFRYSGRTEREILENRVNRDPPDFSRSSVKQQAPKRKKKGAYISNSAKEISHDSMGDEPTTPGTPESPSSPSSLMDQQPDTILEEPPQEAAVDVPLVRETSGWEKTNSGWKYAPMHSLDLDESAIRNLDLSMESDVFQSSAVNHVHASPRDATAAAAATSTPRNPEPPKQLWAQDASPGAEGAAAAAGVKGRSWARTVVATAFVMTLLTLIAIVLVMELDALRDLRATPEVAALRAQYYAPAKRALGIP
ncbi:PREDICTED: FERM domain-containing protein 3-like [Priapulus caudatus]|uniref:FERM domain-containing protein 3-like n=1 Tax=Priapulus caudatus TaxID=37621 RepID=A0ABM1EH71_PRICU|nr:PREDICTED: FERM domain-containing protein 3-like [Priapulus caudatus]